MRKCILTAYSPFVKVQIISTRSSFDIEIYRNRTEGDEYSEKVGASICHMDHIAAIKMDPHVSVPGRHSHKKPVQGYISS